MYKNYNMKQLVLPLEIEHIIPKDDYYTCPNGTNLEFVRYSTRTDTGGVKRNFKQYRCINTCEHCPLRAQCTTSNKHTWRKTIHKNMNWDCFNGS